MKIYLFNFFSKQSSAISDDAYPVIRQQCESDLFHKRKFKKIRLAEPIKNKTTSTLSRFLSKFLNKIVNP